MEKLDFKTRAWGDTINLQRSCSALKSLKLFTLFITFYHFLSIIQLFFLTFHKAVSLLWILQSLAFITCNIKNNPLVFGPVSYIQTNGRAAMPRLWVLSAWRLLSIVHYSCHNKLSFSWSPSSLTSFYILEAPRLNSEGKNSSQQTARGKTISLSGIELFLIHKQLK